MEYKEEIYSAMAVYDLLIYDNGMVFILNKERMESIEDKRCKAARRDETHIVCRPAVDGKGFPQAYVLVFLLHPICLLPDNNGFERQRVPRKRLPLPSAPDGFPLLRFHLL